MQKDKDQASGPFLFSAAALGDLEACGEDKGTFCRELFGGEGRSSNYSVSQGMHITDLRGSR